MSDEKHRYLLMDIEKNVGVMEFDVKVPSGATHMTLDIRIDGELLTIVNSNLPK